MNWLTLCLIGLGLALGEGCLSAASSDATELHLTMSSNGTVLFDGKSFSPSLLPAALKTRRVAPATPILVAIPADAPMDMVKDLGRRLASAGYRRFAFTRPKHTDAAATPRPVRH